MPGSSTNSRTRVRHLAAAAILTGLSGCSGSTALPSLPPASSIGQIKIVHEPSLLPISSAEAYSRVARGAMSCWFGPRGRLSKSHIFHADAAPAMNGGAVEIVVHERAYDQPKPWGYKAYRVVMTETMGSDGPTGGGTRMDAENLRMPEDEAARMRKEVFQWASGTEGCDTPPETAAVAAPTPAPAPAPATKQTNSKSASAKQTK